jgi:hypothetical protein
MKWQIHLAAAALAALAGCGAAPGARPPANVNPTPKPVATQPAQPAGDPLADTRTACEAIISELSGQLPTDKTIAVLPFVDVDAGVRRLGVLAADEVQRILLASGRRLADRQHLNAVLAERDMQLALLSTADAAKRAGELAGADLLLMGFLTEAGRSVLVSGKVVSVQTGRPIAISKSYSIPAAGLGQLMWYVRRPANDRVDAELPPLAIRYDFVISGPGGEVVLPDGATVATGQRFKIRVMPNSDCSLHVLLYDSQGQATVLFPHEKIALATQVRGGVSYEIPDGKKWYWFDEKPGIETFYLVASYTPLTDLARLVAAMRQAGQSNARAAAAARDHIDKVVARGMSAGTSADYRPKGATVKDRGVGGIVDIGWGASARAAAEMDNVVSGHATVVKKVVLNHR